MNISRHALLKDKDVEDFWTSVQTEDSSLNTFDSVLLKIGNAAERYLTLKTSSVKWEAEEKDHPFSGKQKVWTRSFQKYSPRNNGDDSDRLVKLISYITLLPPVLALGAKMCYRKLYWEPLAASMQQDGWDGILKSLFLSNDKVFEGVNYIRNWISTSFTDGQATLKSHLVYGDYVRGGVDVEDPDPDLLALYSEFEDKLAEEIGTTSVHPSFPKILSTLKLPTENQAYTILCERLLIRAWKKALTEGGLDSVAFENTLGITHDAYQALEFALYETGLINEYSVVDHPNRQIIQYKKDANPQAKIDLGVKKRRRRVYCSLEDHITVAMTPDLGSLVPYDPEGKKFV